MQVFVRHAYIALFILLVVLPQEANAQNVTSQITSIGTTIRTIGLALLAALTVPMIIYVAFKLIKGHDEEKSLGEALGSVRNIFVAWLIVAIGISGIIVLSAGNILGVNFT